ncbi:MAG: uracil-DNA glycosylase [Chthonomonadales bacterium]|nr:uracil-DNA glycosylase [Chthonomonadales bacterium]
MIPSLFDEPNADQLARLAAEASTCTACPLADTRTNVVFGEGNPDAPLVFVGEGPGAQEDATGRPFVGRAGKLLDECLLENGMTRKHVYICNVVKCRACIIEGSSVQNRAPRPAEISACSPWLERQLAILRPIVIVCLGGPSASTLIHSGFRMLQERGKWFETSPFAPYIMAALHPAYILRQAGPAYTAARSSLVQDIASARLKVIEARKSPPKTLF